MLDRSVYTTEDIPSLEERIVETERRLATGDSDYPNRKPILRARRLIELLQHGCYVEDCHHGLLVNGKWIVAVSRNRWCVAGRFRWYWFKSIPDLVRRYFREDGADRGGMDPEWADDWRSSLGGFHVL
jgi:hypothetical protein